MFKLPAGSWFIQLVKRIEKHHSLGYSAQLAYFFLLSLFPLLITIFSLLPFLPIDKDYLIRLISDYAPGETLTIIDQTLESVLKNYDGGRLSIGIIGTLWAASNGMNAIIRAMNRAYEIQDDRPFFIVRGISVLFTVAMIGVFVFAMLLPAFGKQVGLFIFSKFGYTEHFLHVWNTLRFGLSIIILFFVFSAIYLLAPNRRLKPVHVFPGAAFSSVGWIAASLGFSYYVNNFGNYSVMYGSLGAIIVLMIWFYITAAVLIIGGEINGLNQELREKKEKNKRNSGENQ